MNMKKILAILLTGVIIAGIGFADAWPGLEASATC